MSDSYGFGGIHLIDARDVFSRKLNRKPGKPTEHLWSLARVLFRAKREFGEGYL
jgi:hypothetical protein